MPSERQHLLEPLGSATSTPISTTRESSLSESNLARKIAAAMREGARPTDDTFDQFMPGDLEIVSRTYWTPIEVATRVAEWLDELSIDTLMDIGSGAGKFCVAAAIVGKTLFRNAPFGTYVITYNGFGGELADAYEQIHVDREMPNVLRMWKKTSSSGDSPRRSRQHC